MRAIALPLAAVACVAVTVNLARAQAAKPPPQETVRHFLSLAHGLYRLAPEDRKTLAAMKADPAPYVAAVRHEMPTVQAAVASDRQLSRLAFGGAILGALGTSEATDLLAQWYISADRITAKAKTRAVRRRAMSLATSLLASLGTTRKPALVTYLLGRLEKMNAAPRGSALEYLLRSSADDPAVRAKLRSLSEKKGAPLHGDPTTNAVLKEMLRRHPEK